MNPVRWLAQARARITARLTETLVRLFTARDTWYEQDADEFADEASRVVRTSQRALAEAVAVSFAEQLSTEGQTFRPVPMPERGVTDLRGVPSEEVYRRPFSEVWNSLGEEDEEQRKLDDRLADAVDAGRQRLEAILDEDLQLAYAEATRRAMQSAPVGRRPAFWRRVPQGTYTCALCLVASTRRYRTSELSPIHPNCDCIVLPIPADSPEATQAGVVIDEELLKKVHYRVRAEGYDVNDSAAAYELLLIGMTDEHGELGPILVRPRKGR